MLTAPQIERAKIYEKLLEALAEIEQATEEMHSNFTAVFICARCHASFAMSLSLSMARAVLTAPRYCDGCLADRETKEEEGGE